MKNLHLPLKKQWFEMTIAGIKTEDYREINYYWVSRFLDFSSWEYRSLFKCTSEIYYPTMIENRILEGSIYFKKFDLNIMTLGYPKANNHRRILTIEHKGIEIRTGNPDWGAEPGKLYFVILHGLILKRQTL